MSHADSAPFVLLLLHVPRSCGEVHFHQRWILNNLLDRQLLRSWATSIFDRFFGNRLDSLTDCEENKIDGDEGFLIGVAESEISHAVNSGN
jgi:hypothetical protein